MPKITNQNYIRFYRRITDVGLAATFLFILLTLLILTPLDLSGEKSLATSGDTSKTSLTLATSGSAELDLLVTSDSGTFASSGTPLTFNVSTNNYTGYTVSIRAKSGTDLTNTAVDGNNNTVNNTFTSISGSGITSSTFDTSTYNGMWGIKPNYYNSTANSDKFYPPPTTSGIVLNRTDCANNTTSSDNTLCKEVSNTYNISIAARATYAQAAGTYTNTYILNATGNYPEYSITYNDASSDNTVSGLPVKQSSTSLSNTSTTVPLASTAPTRTGYTFSGWCSVDNSANTSACSGATYAAGAAYNLSTTDANTVPLYAIWTINQYDCIKRYRLQNADGSWGNYVTETTEKINYGATCSYSKSVTNYKYGSDTATNGASGTTSGTVGVNGLILSLDFYRNTFDVDVNPVINGTTYGGGLAGFTFDVYVDGTQVANDVIDWASWVDYSVGYIRYGQTFRVVANSVTGYDLSNADTSYTVTSSLGLSVPTWTVQQYYVDVNPVIDGTTHGGGLSGFTFNVYINGTLSASNVTDYYQAVNYGSSVRVVANAASNYNITANGDVTKTVTGALTFSPTWTVTKIYMWNATSANCGQTLWDNRDGTERAYTTKMVGNLCWMTTNLMLGKSTETILNSSTSNLPSGYAYTLPASSSSSGVYIADSITCSLTSACYGYYSYTVATANTTTAYSGFIEAKNDICPSGWRLPTQGEFNVLKTSYGTGALLVDNWSAVYTGRYYNGFAYDEYGHYWTATQRTSTEAYEFEFTDVSARTENFVKLHGLGIRCVAKS